MPTDMTVGPFVEENISKDDYLVEKEKCDKNLIEPVLHDQELYSPSDSEEDEN